MQNIMSGLLESMYQNGEDGQELVDGALKALHLFVVKNHGTDNLDEEWKRLTTLLIKVLDFTVAIWYGAGHIEKRGRTMQIDQVHSATTFEAFMNEIWAAPCEPTPDGGLTLYQHPDYDKYHNAKYVARLTGAHRTGGTTLNGEPADTVEWPDGSRAIVTHAGGACMTSTQKKHARS